MKSINTLFRVLLSYPKISSLFAVAIILSISFLLAGQSAYAQCNITGATPDGGQIVVCTGTDTNGLDTTPFSDDITVESGAEVSRATGDVIDTFAGDDKVLIDGGSLLGTPAGDDCVEMDDGNNELHMTSGTLRCVEGISCGDPSTCKITIDDGLIDATIGPGSGGEAILGGKNNDEIYVNGGTLMASDGVIQADDGDDKIKITGGILEQTDSSDQNVDGQKGNDYIEVSNAIIDGTLALDREAINGGPENDTVKLGTGAEILGINTGGSGFDTLIFGMEAPEEAVGFLCSQILSLDPQDGSITINGLLYEWNEFELFVCDLQPVRVTRPIPTLSEWGLIAMAGVLGIAGILAARRKKIFA